MSQSPNYILTPVFSDHSLYHLCQLGLLRSACQDEIRGEWFTGRNAYEGSRQRKQLHRQESLQSVMQVKNKKGRKKLDRRAWGCRAVLIVSTWVTGSPQIKCCSLEESQVEAGMGWSCASAMQGTASGSCHSPCSLLHTADSLEGDPSSTFPWLPHQITNHRTSLFPKGSDTCNNFWFQFLYLSRFSAA